MNQHILVLLTTLTLVTLTACASYPHGSNTLTISSTSSSYDIIEDLNQSIKDPDILKKSANLNDISQSKLQASLQKLQTQPDLAQNAYEEFQLNADIIRLQHLRYWVTLIEEYQQKMGNYPFQDRLSDSINPIYVEVANPVQQAFITQHPPAPAITKGMSEFVRVLETGLGREIDELYDPQYAPDAKPNFYIYKVEVSDGTPFYNFAVHTHQKFLFSKQITPNYNKVEVSNVYNRGVNLIVTSKILFESEPYLQEINKETMKPEFFEQRKQQFLHATKG